MAAWLEERRSEARAALASTPLPTLKDENWRYTSLRGIDFDAFASVSGADATVRTPTVLGDLETAGELVQRGQDVVSVRLDDESRTDTYPYINIDENDVEIGHEATVSKIGEEQLFYLMSRGLSEDEASAMIVSGFVEPITKELPLEYAVEMNRLIQLQMEGSVG